MLEISKIKKGSQIREKLNEETIQRYADHLSNGGIFPAITVFFDGSDYWLGDGWHRVVAHNRIGLLTILEQVELGGEREAFLYALSANSEHGLPRTNADKRRAVEMALADAELAKLSTRKIAELCAVSNALVSEVQNGITPEIKTTKNKENNNLPKQSVLTVNSEIESVNRLQSENLHEDQFVSDLEHDEYTEIDALKDQISDLQDHIAIQHIPDGAERQEANDLISSLRSEIKILKATLDAVLISRNTLMVENKSLMDQCAMQRKQLKKLQGGK